MISTPLSVSLSPQIPYFFYLARDWKHDIKIFLSIFLSFGYNLRAHKLKNEADQSL